MYLCLCHAISEKKVKSLIREQGCGSLQAVQRQCKAGQSCGSCVLRLKNYVSEVKTSFLPGKNSGQQELESN